MMLFSFQFDNENFGVGIETPEGQFNFTQIFEIYQNAKSVKERMNFAFLQVMIELGIYTRAMIQKILSSPWVQAKMETLRLEPHFRYGVPIARPSKIIALGRNYMAHIQELQHEVPKEPLFFCKAPSALIAHEENIVIPEWLNTRVDHEAELAVIIGKPCKNVSEENAMEYVGGYTILNDVTARDLQKEDIDHGNPWFRSKSIDTFCPMGPYFVPVDEIENPQELEIELKVNGEIRQHSNTKHMIFPIPKVISTISKYMTLYPGDIIATGTPEGVSPIKENDVIEITISKLGTLRNRVIKQK